MLGERARDNPLLGQCFLNDFPLITLAGLSFKGTAYIQHVVIREVTICGWPLAFMTTKPDRNLSRIGAYSRGH